MKRSATDAYFDQTAPHRDFRPRLEDQDQGRNEAGIINPPPLALPTEIWKCIFKLIAVDLRLSYSHLKCVFSLGQTSKQLQLVLRSLLGRITTKTAMVMPVFLSDLSLDLDDPKQLSLALESAKALSFLAGGPALFRDLILNTVVGGQGAIAFLSSFLSKGWMELPNNPSLRQLATFVALAIRNLCGGEPKPNWDRISCALFNITTKIANFVRYDNILAHTCWSLAHLSDGPEDTIERERRIKLIIDSGVTKKLIHLLIYDGTDPVKYITPALRAIGNIAAGSNEQTQKLIDENVVTCFSRLISWDDPGLVKTTCWVIANICAGPPEHIQRFFDCGVITPLLFAAEDTKFPDIQREAELALQNIREYGSPQQIEKLDQEKTFKVDLPISKLPPK